MLITIKHGIGAPFVSGTTVDLVNYYDSYYIHWIDGKAFHHKSMSMKELKIMFDNEELTIALLTTPRLT